jgi:hypothetical protein
MSVGGQSRHVEDGLFNVNVRWELILRSLFDDERGCSPEVSKKFDLSKLLQRKPIIVVIRGVADYERLFQICNNDLFQSENNLPEI